MCDLSASGSTPSVSGVSSNAGAMRPVWTNTGSAGLVRT